MIGWFDTHIHLFAPDWQQSPRDLHCRAQALGIDGMLMPGVRVGDWPQLLDLAQQLSGVYLAPGLHPVYADQWSPVAEEQLRDLSQNPQVVAIGEIGLDAVAGPSLAEQEHVFRAQLEIALESELPVLLHSRKTTGRVLEILREMEVGKQVGGIWHGFSGSVQIAQNLMNLGFLIGVGPILLRESAKKLPLAVLELPEDALVLETDAPDMIDGPAGLIEVAKRLAVLKDWTLEKTMHVTGDNARLLFKLWSVAEER